jgi:hypothetical protein
MVVALDFVASLPVAEDDALHHTPHHVDLGFKLQKQKQHCQKTDLKSFHSLPRWFRRIPDTFLRTPSPERTGSRKKRCHPRLEANQQLLHS